MGLRDQFKATAREELNNQQKELSETMGFSDNEFISLNEGKNLIRIFPKHPNKSTFTTPKGVHFLPFVKEVEEGGKTEKKEYRKPVYSGLIHSPLKKCIVDEYIQAVWGLAEQTFKDDKKKKKEFAKRLSGMQGIYMSQSWPTYAKIITKRKSPDQAEVSSFGILELKTSVKDRLNSIAASMDDGGSMIAIDPFTHPDTGICVSVTYKKKPNEALKEKYYSTDPDLKGAYPLTDAELEEFIKKTPLQDIYTDAYKRSDFLLALEGLKRFDEAAEDFNIFSSEEWHKTVDEYGSYYPEEEAEDENTTTDEVAQTSPPAEEVKKVETVAKETATSPAVTEKSVEQMTRKELEEYIKVKGYLIRVLQDDTKPDIIALIKREEKLQASLTGDSEEKSFIKGGNDLPAMDKVEEKKEEGDDGMPDNPLEFLKGQVD